MQNKFKFKKLALLSYFFQRSVLFFALLVSFLLVSPYLAFAQTCSISSSITSGAVLSSTTLDEVAIIAGDVRPLEIVSRITDITADGIREVLALEGSNKIIIRNGATLESIVSGAFPFQLPAGSVPTQMGLIGDLQGDGSEEIGISVRYLGNNSGESAFVFNGASRSLLETFPAILRDLTQKINLAEPLYPNPPATSRMGTSVQVATVEGMRAVIYADPQANGGTVIFRTTCPEANNENQTLVPCYDVRTLHDGRVVPHNLGVKMLGFDVGTTRSVLLADPSSDLLPVTIQGVTDFRKNRTGSIVRFDDETLSVFKLGSPRANLRFSFDLTFSAAPILGQNALLASAPTDGISASDTGQFFVFGLTSPIADKFFVPQLSEENLDIGYSFDGGDDLTGDGVADIVLGAPGQNNEGRVRIYTPGADFFNRSILRVDGNGIRFGHSVATVGAGRLVVADASGNLFALSVAGEQRGGTEAILCTPPAVAATPTPVGVIPLDNTELKALRTKARRISSLLGGLKFRSGRAGANKTALDAILRQTNAIDTALTSATLIVREKRFDAAYRTDFNKRASALQKRFNAGNSTQRRNAQKSLTAKANQIVQYTNAAIRG